jgi:hypothetical protein
VGVTTNIDRFSDAGDGDLTGQQKSLNYNQEEKSIGFLIISNGITFIDQSSMQRFLNDNQCEAIIRDSKERFL